MSEKKYPRRSDSKKRNDDPELILESDDETSYNQDDYEIETSEELPSTTLADEPMSMETSRRSKIFGNEFFEIRERFFRVVDSRPGMMPHDLKCILWDMLPPYDEEYPSQTASRLIGKIDDIYRRMGDIETSISPDGNFGRVVRVIQRKVDKVQGITEYILDLARGETEACTMAEKLNPVIDILRIETHNSVKKLNDASENVKSAVIDVDKLCNRVSLPLKTAIMYWIILVAFGLFQITTTLGYFVFNMALSDLGWMIWIAPAIVALVSILTVANNHFNHPRRNR